MDKTLSNIDKIVIYKSIAFDNKPHSLTYIFIIDRSGRHFFNDKKLLIYALRIHNNRIVPILARIQAFTTLVEV